MSKTPYLNDDQGLHLQVETRGTTSTARSARNLTAHSKSKLKPQLWNSWRSNFEMQINQRQDWYRGRYRSLHLVSCWTVWVYHTLLQLFLSPGPLWPVGRCYAVSTETGNFSAGRIWITFLLAEISPCISDRYVLKKKKKSGFFPETDMLYFAEYLRALLGC